MDQVILFSAGGTLGHINPALTMISHIKKKNPKIKIIFFATTKDKRFTILTSNSDIDQIYYFDVLGVSKNIIKLSKAFFKNIKTAKEIANIIVKEKITLGVGMGGYISGIVLNECAKLSIPIVIHEQNSVIGLANKLILKKANLIFTSFVDTNIPTKYKDKVKWIGNPRYDVVKNVVTSQFQTQNHILITSGSLGSKRINELAIDFLNSKYSKKYTTTLITGERYYDEVIQKVKKGYHYQIKPFSPHLVEELNLASIVISRAGSSTLFEILALKKIAMIIPSPNVTKNHQYFNALDLANQGLLYLIQEKELTKKLEYYLEAIIQKKDEMSKALNHFQLANVCDTFYENIQVFLQNKSESMNSKNI